VIDSALGRMSVACGPASMLLAKDSVTETTTAKLSNTTDRHDGHREPADVTLSPKNTEEHLQLDHIGQFAINEWNIVLQPIARSKEKRYNAKSKKTYSQLSKFG